MDTANFVYEHPRGAIYGWFSNKGLRCLLLPAGPSRRKRLGVLHSSANDRRVWDLHAALERYFAGMREDFAAVPLDLSDGTPFRRSVWNAARAIGWGDTATYGTLARRIGKPSAARAVGQALGANPVSIVVPCHRILSGSGGLGGFGAGLPWKRELLRTEGSLPEA